MFFVVFCKIHRKSFCLFPHLIIHTNPRMICILTITPIQSRRLQWWIVALLLFEDLNGCPRSIVNFFYNDVLVFTRKTRLELMRPCPRSDNGCHRSIINQFINFPLLRRPSFVIVPPWVACLVRALNKMCGGTLTRDLCHSRQRVAPFNNLSQHFPHSFSSIRLSDAKDDRVEGSPCNQTRHHWPRLCCDFFYTWFFLRSFWLHFRQTVQLKC